MQTGSRGRPGSQLFSWRSQRLERNGRENHPERNTYQVASADLVASLAEHVDTSLDDDLELPDRLGRYKVLVVSRFGPHSVYAGQGRRRIRARKGHSRLGS